MTGFGERRLVVVTGKGGTGRTTVAAALACAAAAKGRRVAVAEVGGARRLPALVDGDVDVVAIDPATALEEWLRSVLPGALSGLLARSGTFGAFVGAAPGARELVTITKAWELGAPRRWTRGEAPYDTVILDAPASGHGVGMLRTPRTFADIARVGPIASQARIVAETLADPAQSAIVAVAQPGELAVAETLELEVGVETALGRRVDAIVVNGVWPRRVAQRQVPAVGPPFERAVRAAASRVRAQRAQLERLRREAAAPVRTLPFVFSEGLGAAQISAFSARLDGGH